MPEVAISFLPDVPAAPVESPPLAPQPVREPPDDPRDALHRIASELIRTRNRRLLIEFLTLRRSLR